MTNLACKSQVGFLDSGKWVPSSCNSYSWSSKSRENLRCLARRTCAFLSGVAGAESLRIGRDTAGTLDRVLPFTVTKPVTIREMSNAVDLRGTSLVFGEVLWKVAVYTLCPLIADRQGQQPDLALESPWKPLRVYDDVKVSRSLGSVMGTG